MIGTLVIAAELRKKGGHQRTQAVRQQFELRPARSMIAVGR